MPRRDPQDILDNVRAAAVVVIIVLVAFAVIVGRDVSLVATLLGAGGAYLGIEYVRRRNGS